jgi:molecular chaperone GrpE
MMSDTEQATPHAAPQQEHESGAADPSVEETPVAGSLAAEDGVADAGAPDAGATSAGTPSAGTPDGEAADAEAEEVLRGDVTELVATAAKRDEYLALAQRTQADFENYRKRVARDLAAAQERGVSKLARELLPALDNLDRALEAAAPGDPLLEGVRLVRAELAAALGRVGLESFTPDGEPFDPEQHEAIVQRPVEGVESGRVAEVYQPGYRLNGAIIRPARVVVAA